MVHGIRELLKRSEGPVLDTPLWPWSRTTGYRRVTEVMAAAGIEEGPHRCPKGLRHGYGVAAISAAVPLNMLRKWIKPSTEYYDLGGIASLYIDPISWKELKSLTGWPDFTPEQKAKAKELADTVSSLGSIFSKGG